MDRTDAVNAVTEDPPDRARAVPATGRRLAAAAFVLAFAGLDALPAYALAVKPPAADAATRVHGRAGGGAPAAPVVQGDQIRDQQWHLRTLGLQRAWGLGTGKGVTVAVIDSGVDATHPDLAGQVLPGEDLVADTGDGRADPVGHGTTVAALIAGRGDDSAGVVGIAPDAKILPIRVLDQRNRYDDALVVAQAVRWAVDNGAQVINLSLGGGGNSAALAAAIDYAFAKDVVVVACTGNLAATDTADVWYPAREPGVLAVAGLDRTGAALWPGSITGPQTVLAAPATELHGARSGGGYWRVQGTSFAAPMVAGVAALIRSRWPDLSAADVVNRLINTARDLGETGRDAQYGFGMVDPFAALTAQLTAVSRNPLDTTPSPGVARLGSAPGTGGEFSTEPVLPGPVGGRKPIVQSGAAASPPAQPAEPPAQPAEPPAWLGTATVLITAGAAWLAGGRAR